MTKLREFYEILAKKVTDELVVTNLTSADYHWRALTEPGRAIYTISICQGPHRSLWQWRNACLTAGLFAWTGMAAS